MKENKSVVLIGGGRSVLTGIELGLFDKIKGMDIWSLNFAYKSMPYLPSTEIWIDKMFFTQNIKNLQGLHEKGVNLITAYNSKYDKFPEVTTYKTSRCREEYFGAKMLDSGKIFVGTLGQCGFFALSMAICYGYNRIYLLGYDFGTPSYEDKITHFYQEDVEKLKIISKGVGKKDVYYNKEGKIKEGLNDYSLYTRENIPIYNVSLRSNINCFNKLSYSEFFKVIKRYEK